MGARPNFMKIAPILKEFEKRNYSDSSTRLVHTGQHYDVNMSDIFFKELSLPKPQVYLGVGSGTQATQTANVMIKYEKLLSKEPVDLVIVVGDVNSTLACALVAVKFQIPIAHIEAGLRSDDWSMPEEINRILTDRISTYLFTTSKEGSDNLLKEGISRKRIHFVGNVMIDSLIEYLPLAMKSSIIERLHVKKDSFALLTLHRPSNVDDRSVLSGIMSAVNEVSSMLPVVFPAHPRTVNAIGELQRSGDFSASDNLHIIDPVGYIDSLSLQYSAKFVLTDSGGMQEETTVLGIPCLTIRANTERPVTVTKGTNIMVGSDPQKIISESVKLIKGVAKKGSIPEKWDGKSARKIVDIIRREMHG